MYTFDPDGVRHGPFVLIWIIFILNLFSYYQKNAVFARLHFCETHWLEYNMGDLVLLHPLYPHSTGRRSTALCESAMERHVERYDLPKRLLITNWSLTDLHDRQDRHQLTLLHKDPWRFVQNANRSLLGRINHIWNANWSPISRAIWSLHKNVNESIICHKNTFS